MNFKDAMKDGKDGKSVMRSAWKSGRLFKAKIVPVKRKPYLWQRTGIPGIYTWSKIEDPSELFEENTLADDWKVCKRPS